MRGVEALRHVLQERQGRRGSQQRITKRHIRSFVKYGLGSTVFSNGGEPESKVNGDARDGEQTGIIPLGGDLAFEDKDKEDPTEPP